MVKICRKCGRKAKKTDKHDHKPSPQVAIINCVPRDECLRAAAFAALVYTCIKWRGVWSIRCCYGQFSFVAYRLKEVFSTPKKIMQQVVLNLRIHLFHLLLVCARAFYNFCLYAKTNFFQRTVERWRRCIKICCLPADEVAMASLAGVYTHECPDAQSPK